MDALDHPGPAIYDRHPDLALDRTGERDADRRPGLGCGLLADDVSEGPNDLVDGLLGHLAGVVAGQADGTWQNAIEVPGTATRNRGGAAFVTSVSCASAGNCSAGGYYTDSSGHEQVFVVSKS